MTTTLDRETFTEDWRSWHAAREEALRRPDGWLSLTGLYWLDTEPTILDEVPGSWRVDGERVLLESDGGTEAHEPIEGAPGVRVAAGDGYAEIIRRTGRFAVRIHDPKSPALAAFTGIPAYEPAPEWVLQGRFEAFDQARTVTTGAVVDGLEHHHSAAGLIRFTHDGAEHRLVAFGDGSGPLRVLFTDGTSGVTTYPAARILEVAAPTADGSVTLDFTRAANLPCAFTDAATCPIAPAENRLRFAVEAGERTPRDEEAR
ncbi:DUF1684 domain-containing protein [Rhodococcus sp. 2H158]|nr:hypothetical protein GQ85_04985 [Rhodococcus rhodochrous]